MDNELKIFLQSFKELENLFRVLPITEAQFEKLRGILSGIQKNAKHLALYDAITHALNARAGKWLIPVDQITGMGKVDIYDLRQANKVYGASVVDSELHKLAFQLMSISADGSVNGKNDGRNRTCRSSRSKKRCRKSCTTPLRLAKLACSSTHKPST